MVHAALLLLMLEAVTTDLVFTISLKRSTQNLQLSTSWVGRLPHLTGGKRTWSERLNSVAWYTVTGETCLETPEGIQVGRAGGQFVIVPGGPPMHLTATGKEQRQALVLILHDSTKPATTLVSDWTPKGLCKN